MTRFVAVRWTARVARLHLQTQYHRPAVRAWFVAGTCLLLLVLAGIRVSNHHALTAVYGVQLAWTRLEGLGFYVLPLLIAVPIASRAESGMRTQRLVDGEAAWHQTAIDLATAMITFTIATLALLGSVGILCGFESWIAGPGHGEPTTWSYVLGQVGTGMLLLLLVASAVGYVAGATSRTRVAAASVVVMLALGTQVLRILIASSYPGLEWLYVLTPQGAASTISGAESLVGSGNGAKLWAAEVSTVAFLATAPAIGRRAFVGWLSPRSQHRSESTRRGLEDGRNRAARSGTIAVLCVGFGALVPVALRSEVPWSLRPSWLADQAAHRTSLDVARALLRDVHDGNFQAANDLTATSSARRLLGPYWLLLARGPLATATLQTRALGDPGLISVTTRGGQSFALCAQRKPKGWVIVQTRSDGQCPSALPAQ